jgi:hypothetical protein
VQNELDVSALEADLGLNAATGHSHASASVARLGNTLRVVANNGLPRTADVAPDGTNQLVLHSASAFGRAGLPELAANKWNTDEGNHPFGINNVNQLIIAAEANKAATAGVAAITDWVRHDFTAGGASSIDMIIPRSHLGHNAADNETLQRPQLTNAGAAAFYGGDSPFVINPAALGIRPPVEPVYLNGAGAVVANGQWRTFLQPGHAALPKLTAS